MTYTSEFTRELTSFVRWILYKDKFESETDAQNDLRVKFLKFLKENKVTQRSIANEININESILSAWKNNRSIPVQISSKKNRWTTACCSHLLDDSYAERIYFYLYERGY